MLDRKEVRIRVGYIRAQAISYFLFALLLFQVAAENMDSMNVSLSWYKLGFLRLPGYDFSFWLLVIVAVALVGLSLFLLVGVFARGVREKAVDVALGMSIPFGILLPTAFVISWITGLIPIVGESNTIFKIPFYAGAVVFLAVQVEAFMFRDK